MGDSPLFRAPYLFTVLLGLSLLVYCSFTAFSINVLDENENPHNQPPPWPTLQSPASSRRWRGLKSSGKMMVVSHHPVNLKKKNLVVDVVGVGVEPERALQGMGTLFRKGTRSMRELVVAHLSENTTSAHLRLFLRTLHRSGATARADVVLLFPGTASSGVAFPPELVGVIVEEEASFQRLLALSNASADTDTSNSTLSPFNSISFKDVEAPRDPAQVMWGSNQQRSKATSSLRYGSIVGFAMQELDAHNEMSGFFDEPPPAQLRRWVCYDMILGMVRSKYKNVILTPVDGVLVLGDAFSPVRRRPNHLYLSGEDESWSDSPPSVYNEELWRKLREKTVVSSSFAMGRVDWVRKLASKMATEIVRIALEEKKKKTKRRRSDRPSGCSFFHDKALLNYLVHESSVLGKRVLEHVRIVANKDSVVHSLVGTSDQQPLNAVWKRRKSGNYAVIQGLADSERGVKVLASVHDDICRSASEVYVDCLLVTPNWEADASPLTD